MAKQFGGFTPAQQHQLLTKMGYQGPAQSDDMQKFMAANPSAALAMGRYTEMAKKRIAMAYGGMVKEYNEGGYNPADSLQTYQMQDYNYQPSVMPIYKAPTYDYEPSYSGTTYSTARLPKLYNLPNQYFKYPDFFPAENEKFVPMATGLQYPSTLPENQPAATTTVPGAAPMQTTAAPMQAAGTTYPGITPMPGTTAPTGVKGRDYFAELQAGKITQDQYLKAMQGETIEPTPGGVNGARTYNTAEGTVATFDPAKQMFVGPDGQPYTGTIQIEGGPSYKVTDGVNAAYSGVNAYDPSTGLPTLPEGADIDSYLSGEGAVPDFMKDSIKNIIQSGNIPSDPNKYTITGGPGNWTITFENGASFTSPNKNPASAENDAKMAAASLSGYKDIGDDELYQSQIDEYKQYLTERAKGTLANIEEEYTNTKNTVQLQQYELAQLNMQLQQDPENVQLQQLVADKAKELTASTQTMQAMQPAYMATQKTMPEVMAERAAEPTLPEGGTVTAQKIAVEDDQFIPSTSGQVGTGAGDFGVQDVALAGTTTADVISAKDAATYQADTSAEGVNALMNTVNAAQTNEDDPRAQITAAQTTASMVGNLKAAQGNAILINNQVNREIQDGELIDGVADAQKAAAFTEQIEAATATPTEKATVQGQLSELMQQFEGGETPTWAAGAMRAATATMAARGLSASSMAGQAVVQAAMESALPIAMADAATQAQFEQQNLSNRQQRAMLAAQQRAAFMGQEFDQAFQARVANASAIADVANMNFTAEQQIQLENSRIANTMNLENLSNKQALVIAEASALAGLDLSNLNNRQQAAVQNAANFLQMDMANLSNEQQTEIFRAQQRTASLFSDQAANNAAAQFNATSENQVNQFYDNLASQVNMFNAEQANAQERYNSGQINAMNQFNAEMKNQREQFNAQNQLIIDQSNAQWRREIATADTAAANRAAELNAKAVLDISDTAYNNMWQYYGDTMEWAWQSGENEATRNSNYAMQILANKASAEEAAAARDAASSNAIGQLVGSVVSSDAFLNWVF